MRKLTKLTSTASLLDIIAALAWLVSACAATTVSPYQLYSQAIVQANEDLKAQRIGTKEWLDISDKLLLEHITGDFSVLAFIERRRAITAMVDEGKLARDQGAAQVAEAFREIRETMEARFYAQQLDLKYADVMSDIRHKGAFAQSVAGDLGIVGGLAIGARLR